MAAAQLGAISGRQTPETARLAQALIGIQGGSDRVFNFMAKYGIGCGSAEGGAVERHMLGFQAAYARRGIRLELGEWLTLGYQFHIASSPEQAIREAASHYEENMKMVRRIAPRAGLDPRADHGDARPAAGRHREIADDRGCGEGGRFLAGRPEEIIEQLKAVEKRYPGLDRVICATPLDLQLEDPDRFAKEVIPAFRDTRTAAAAQ